MDGSVPSMVAETGGYEYDSLAAAIAAAKDGDTVRLLRDVTVNSGSNAVRYDGGTRDLVFLTGIR